MSPAGRKLWVIACLALVLAVAWPARAGQLGPWTRQALQQALQTAVRDYHLAGAAALVRSPSGETWYGAAGWAHAPRGVPRGVADHNGIGSVTKTFTSILALQLVEEGRLGLADTVEEVLPGLLAVGDKVTVRDLLLMQSGLQHYEERPEVAERVEADPLYRRQPRELARLADGLAFPPGEGFDYNNVNYVILGMMVAELDGRPWEESLRRRILGPPGAGEHRRAARRPDRAAAGGRGPRLAGPTRRGRHPAALAQRGRGRRGHALQPGRHAAVDGRLLERPALGAGDAEPAQVPAGGHVPGLLVRPGLRGAGQRGFGLFRQLQRLVHRGVAAPGGLEPGGAFQRPGRRAGGPRQQRQGRLRPDAKGPGSGRLLGGPASPWAG